MRGVALILLLIALIAPARAGVPLATSVRAPDHVVLGERLTYEVRIQTSTASLLAVDILLDPAQTVEAGVVADWAKEITRPCSFKRNRALCLVDSTGERAASVFVNVRVTSTVPAEQQALFLIRDPRGYQAEERVTVRVQDDFTMYLPILGGTP